MGTYALRAVGGGWKANVNRFFRALPAGLKISREFDESLQKDAANFKLVLCH